MPSSRRTPPPTPTYSSEVTSLSSRSFSATSHADMLRGVHAAYGSRHTSGSPDGGAVDSAELNLDLELEADGEDEDYTGPHDLALLFMVFAVGVLAVAAEAEHLHQIARAALALQPVLEKPSLVTIQVLHLLSIYTVLASPPTGHARLEGREEDGETSMEMPGSLTTQRRGRNISSNISSSGIIPTTSTRSSSHTRVWHDQGHNQGMYAHPQHATAYQARNAKLAQLGLAARDSRLDERWSTFMEDSGCSRVLTFAPGE
ncbi:hypothetical protein B0H14DRAFT_3594886 [Mycena olivaceomarginata]|nr:hypothetical protein B0H14DRAFT_3594886 [Mycena olivaceomarginata]